MKATSSFLIAITAIISVILQFFLMMENRVAAVTETVIRFFSFFTILTNLLVGIYFVFYFINLKKNKFSFINKSGKLTAITVYITIVGLVYQFALRHIWEPKGLQRLVDELLHSIVPLFVVLFWYFYEEKNTIKFKSVLYWLIYPIFYLIFILFRGNFSSFYPYPFIDVVKLGFSKVMLNSCLLLFVFIFISAIFIKIGHKLTSKL